MMPSFLHTMKQMKVNFGTLVTLLPKVHATQVVEDKQDVGEEWQKRKRMCSYNHGQKSWDKFTFVALFHTNSSTLVQPLL